MTIRPKPLVALLLLGGAFDRGAFCGSLTRVWELNIKDGIERAIGQEVRRPGITAIRFSTDGGKVAVAVSGYFRSQATRLLVIDVGSHNLIQQFELASHTVASDSDVYPGRPPSIAWSPKGEFILVSGDVIRVRDGKACSLPGIFVAGFLSPERIIALSPRKPLRLEIFDTACRLIDTMGSDESISGLVDISPEKSLVSVLLNTPTKYPGSSEYIKEMVVIDPIAKTVIQRWPTIQKDAAGGILWTGSIGRFADSGTVFCAGTGGDHSIPPEDPPRCMDVDTGKVVAEAEYIKGGAAFAAAQLAARVVASDFRASWNFLFHENDSALRRRVVWDFRKNVEIASWKPEMQNYDTGGPRSDKAPFMFAISPDGQYVAEGGNGVLRLSKIVGQGSR